MRYTVTDARVRLGRSLDLPDGRVVAVLHSDMAPYPADEDLWDLILLVEADT